MLKDWIWKRKSKMAGWAVEAIVLSFLMVLSVREANQIYTRATPMLQQQVNALVNRVSEELATPAGYLALKMLLFKGLAFGIPLLFAVMWIYRLVAWCSRMEQRQWEKRPRTLLKKGNFFDT